MPAKKAAKKNDELLPIGAKKRSSKKKEETVVQSKNTGEAVKKMGQGIVGVLQGAYNAVDRYGKWVQKKNQEIEEKRIKALQEQKAQAGQAGASPAQPGDKKNLKLFQGAVRYGGLGQAARPGKMNLPEPPATSIWDLAGEAMKKEKKKE